MEKTSPIDVVNDYNRALGARDFTAARALMADDLRFEGPIDRFSRADDYLTAIKGLYGMVKGVEPQATIAQGDNVAFFYLLDTPIAKAPVAEWYVVRAYFDARPFAAAAAAGQAGGPAQTSR